MTGAAAPPPAAPDLSAAPSDQAAPPEPGACAPPGRRIWGLERNVFWAGVVSFFMDVSSEMI